MAFKTPPALLSVCKKNPRYFAGPNGKAVFLTGSHTWDTLMDRITGNDKPFDFTEYLDFLETFHHNFIRLWTWEFPLSPMWSKDVLTTCSPLPWLRTGPGKAQDGKPKFDLRKFNPEYFTRLRDRVREAGERGIYVSVMLFEAWGINQIKEPWNWKTHPFNAKNNVNGIDGKKGKDGKGLEVHSLKIPKITAIQEAYVRKVVDVVNDLDNTLYEISNEAPMSSTEFQYHMIRFIKEYEKSKPAQHMIGMTSDGGGPPDDRARLFNSPADWISPGWDASFTAYKDDPPATLGDKVILLDTDHCWGVGGDRQWVWKCLLRGYNPIYMDPYKNKDSSATLYWADAVFQRARKAMGHALDYSRKMNLTDMRPVDILSSTRYCLANPGKEYLVYQPNAGPFKLTFGPGNFKSEWFDPDQEQIIPGENVSGNGEEVRFDPPFGGDAVLYLKVRTV